MTNVNDSGPAKEGTTVVEFPETDSLKDQAAQWVAKLDTDKPDAATLRAFKQWINQSDEHRQLFEKHLALWNDMNVLTRIVPPAYSQATDKPRSRAGFAYWPQSLAACLLLVLLVVVQVTQPPGSYSTAVGEQKTVQLPDGSTVILNTNTRISLDFNQARRTITLLKGEAHFEVAHNPDQPFEVIAGKGTVRAIGTAFTVYLKSDDVEVVVTEGTVAVLPQAPPPANQATTTAPPVTLAQQKASAGTVVTYDRHTAEHMMQTALGDSSDKLSWHKGVLVFRNEPLEHVIAEVNRYTNKKIIIPDQAIRNLKVGGFFKVDDIDSVFDALEKGFDIKAREISEGLIYLVHTEE